MRQKKILSDTVDIWWLAADDIKLLCVLCVVYNFSYHFGCTALPPAYKTAFEQTRVQPNLETMADTVLVSPYYINLFNV